MSIQSTVVIVAGTIALSMTALARAENPEQSGFTWDQEAQKNLAAPAAQPTEKPRLLHAMSDAPRFHKFTLQRNAQDDEQWDVTHQMDPRTDDAQN